MSAIKGTNFRVNEETADAFRNFCKEQGMNQAQGFDHLMQIMELNKAKEVIPGRRTEIEDFETLTKSLNKAYLHSLAINEDSESRVKEQFASQLERKDKAIESLQQKTRLLQAELDASSEAESNALKACKQAEKDLATVQQMKDSAEKTAADKALIANTLSEKLAEVEARISDYDAIKDSYDAIKRENLRLEQLMKEIEYEASEKIKDIQHDAELRFTEAIHKKNDEMNVAIDNLKDELRISKSETVAALKDAETARAAVIAELSKEYQRELSALQKRLDDRTEEYVALQQKLNEIQLLLQKERSKVTELQLRLNSTIAN